MKTLGLNVMKRCGAEPGIRVWRVGDDQSVDGISPCRLGRGHQGDHWGVTDGKRKAVMVAWKRLDKRRRRRGTVG